MGMAVDYGMPLADSAVSNGGMEINWLLVGVILGSVILGIVFGILLGRRTMKKRDI